MCLGAWAGHLLQQAMGCQHGVEGLGTHLDVEGLEPFGCRECRAGTSIDCITRRIDGVGGQKVWQMVLGLDLLQHSQPTRTTHVQHAGRHLSKQQITLHCRHIRDSRNPVAARFANSRDHLARHPTLERLGRWQLTAEDQRVKPCLVKVGNRLHAA